MPLIRFRSRLRETSQKISKVDYKICQLKTQYKLKREQILQCRCPNITYWSINCVKKINRNKNKNGGFILTTKYVAQYSSSSYASHFDLHLEIDNDDLLRTKFQFSIVNFPFICSKIPAEPVYEVYTSQLILYSRAWISYQDFLDGMLLISRQLRNQWVHSGVKLKSSRFTVAIIT